MPWSPLNRSGRYERENPEVHRHVGALPPFKSGMLGNPIQCRIVFDLRTIAAGLNEKIPTVLGLR